MVGSISIGDTLKCLFCEKEFILEHIDFDTEKEYVKCPHCEKSADIQKYHFDMRGIDLNSVMRDCAESLSQAKQEGSMCRQCLFWEFENGKRGAFCLKNGEIDKGADKLCEKDFNISLHKIICLMNNEQRERMWENKDKADNCIDFVDKKTCLKEIREKKRII